MTDRPLMSRSARTLALLAFALFAIFAPAAIAAPAEFAGASADGEKAFFTTAAKLVPGDTDNGFVDVYERFYDPPPGAEAFVTREISTGPTGGNDSYNVTFDAVTEDGNLVFFSTAESLVEEDKDHALDVYRRSTQTGETVLLSGGAPTCGCGNAEAPVTYVGSTPTGSKVFFASTESLSENDGDGSSDVYARDPSAAGPVLVSPGGSAPATFLGASPSGFEVVFETTDKLSIADGDTETDIYERDLGAGTTQLVSVGGTCPVPLAAECAPIYRAVEAGGGVFFETKAQLALGDGDEFQDVYRWSPLGGTVSLVSTGSEGEEGKGNFNAVFAGVVEVGTVYFETAERLSADDEDGSGDVYAREGGTTTLVSPGTADAPASFNFASSDGTTVLFSTSEALAVPDSGEKIDVYASGGSGVELVSAGSPGFESTFADSSADASRVFYVTSQPLDPGDSDTNPDIYESSAGDPPLLVSTGPTGGNGPYTPHLAAVSEDAGHAFFTTRERLTADDDLAEENDVYDFVGSETVLVSVGNDAQLQLAPPSPSLTGSNPSSPNTTLEPRIFGQAAGGNSIKLYPTPDCSGAPAGIGTVAELNGSGVKVTVKAGSTTTFHATATNAAGDTSACSSSSVTYAQQDEAPPSEGGSGGGSSGGDGGTGSTDGGSTPATGGSKPSGSVPPVVKIGNYVYVAPLTKITVAPLAKTHSRRPVFQFVDSIEQPNTKFFCRIDRERWKGCTSPYRPKHRLTFRKHTFAVKGKSFAGQWEQHPVVRKFKVVRP